MQHTVLVVEDELLIQLAMVEHLEECGYLTHQAANAHDAMAILAHDPNIEIVFTDVRMPGDMDGLGLAKWIVKHKPHIAVMIASGHAAKDIFVTQLCGVHTFSKPYRLHQ